MDREKNTELRSPPGQRTGIAAAVAILTIAALAVCLTGAAWAWYSSSVTSGESVLSGGGFDVAVSAAPEPVDGWYVFTGEEAASLVLTRLGSAGGYCLIEAVPQPGEGETEAATLYYTSCFENELTLSISGAGRLRITPHWGAPAGSPGILLENGAVLQLAPVSIPIETSAEEETEPSAEQPPEPSEEQTPEPEGEQDPKLSEEQIPEPTGGETPDTPVTPIETGEAEQPSGE